jgi:hypothetical protein
MAYETGVSVGVGCDGVVLVLAVNLILTVMFPLHCRQRLRSSFLLPKFYGFAAIFPVPMQSCLQNRQN